MRTRSQSVFRSLYGCTILYAARAPRKEPKSERSVYVIAACINECRSCRRRAVGVSQSAGHGRSLGAYVGGGYGGAEHDVLGARTDRRLAAEQQRVQGASRREPAA